MSLNPYYIWEVIYIMQNNYDLTVKKKYDYIQPYVFEVYLKKNPINYYHTFDNIFYWDMRLKITLQIMEAIKEWV
jgi:hypothetical protein